MANKIVPMIVNQSNPINMVSDACPMPRLHIMIADSYVNSNNYINFNNISADICEVENFHRDRLQCAIILSK